MRSSSVEEVGGHGPGDPWEVFTALAVLVVEGRTPGGDRGYHAGPHCPLPHQLQHKHSCDPNQHVCMQASALWRQLRVMWGVGVGVTLEVLVAPECGHGAALASTLDTTTAPTPNLRLIEQWNFTIYDRRLPEATTTGWSLMAAVRSFLHFSQLSAWLSVSGGRRPPNVLYRLTVTSPVFCSKFTAEAEEHVFPITYMGQDTSIKVSVRSLPRSENFPVVECPEAHGEQGVGVSAPEALPSSSRGPSSSGTTTATTTNTPSSSQTRPDNTRCEDDLRRSVMKAKLAENTRVSRSASPDTQLGESLLDPPHSLTRFPRRYQSPSRSGSPSQETPEHLICRPRPPAPHNTKPPDYNMMIGPAPTSHPFSWTQARYPMTPIVHPPSMDSMCPPNADGMHPHQHPQHHHQLAQNSYGFDFSGTYQPYRRHQLVYNRPQMCWPQMQQVVHHKPQVTLHPHQTPLAVNPCSYTSHQKVPSPMSPRGGKYQYYPEYQGHRETPDVPAMTGEYPEPFSSPDDGVLVSEYQQPHPHSHLKGVSVSDSSRPSTSTAQEGGRDQGVKRRGEYVNEYEYQGEHQTCKREYYQKPVPVSEASQHSMDQRPHCSTQGKQEGTKLSTLMQEDIELPKILDDEMRPCCSHTGKHLCASIEDLTEVGSAEEKLSAHLYSKDLKQRLKQRGDMSPSHLYNTKVNFDLTPKETMEILSVLRQPGPLPPLRMDRHRGYQALSPRGAGECSKTLDADFAGDGGVGSKSWESKSYVSKFLKDRGKNVESKSWTEEKCESIGKKSENFDTIDTRGQKAAGSWSECRKSVDPAFPPSISSPGQLSERCHNKNMGRGTDGMQELPSSPENLFLEAIARSGGKHCDIPSCKTFVDSREAYRTRVCRDASVVSCDNASAGVSSEASKCDTKIINERNVQSSSETKCVEAKKVTQKMRVFTASSESAKPAVAQPMKQTSQTLLKSPFSAVLSSIQKENSRVLEDEESHCQETEKLRTSHIAKEFVKRALNFEVLKSEEILRTASQSSVTITSKERAAKEGGQDVAVQNGKDADRPLWDTREGFVKSTSLLKHLMTTKCHHQTQDITQGNKQIQLEEDGMDWKEFEEQQQLDRETLEMEVLESLENFVDNEVEKICNEKGIPIPSASAKAQFRRSLDSATNMVFHSKTGLPLTSSPAPLRKGKRFDYDSTLNCVAAIKRSTSFHCSALYTCDSEEDENYSVEMSNNSEVNNHIYKPIQLSTSAPATVTCSNLLGSFEECVLNGRLEPVSTVQGFTAEIAASGAFCPKRTTKPVTVFFYTLCDNDQISSPYMGHINLGKKGYHVPNKGTVQVTLFNPHGTVVKMFVVMYDLSDMPPNSRTFVRQRTLNMPVGATDSDLNAHQWLRYLIHLRFVSSKSGKIYLHTDIRMLIFRKSDADAANLHKTNVPYELRSFTHGPTNPKFSPRK